MIEKFFKSHSVPKNHDGFVQLNVALYGSPRGIPARFFTGFIPVILLAKEIISGGANVIVRAFNPITITTFCNGWQYETEETQNERAIFLAKNFFERQGVPFFIDISSPVTDEMILILNKLEEAIVKEPDLQDITKRLQTSGLRYGGEVGRKRSLIYAAAHPFGWQDLWHHSLWPQRPNQEVLILNIMSEAEKRFSAVRQFLVSRFRELSLSEVCDIFTKTCEIPHYILFPGEPSIEVLLTNGAGECAKRYGYLLENAKRNSEKETIRGLIKDFNYTLDFMRQYKAGNNGESSSVFLEEIFDIPTQHFNIFERRSLLFLKEADAVIKAENKGWVASLESMEIGEHRGHSLYVTPKGRPFVYSVEEGIISEVLYKDIYGNK